MSIVVNTELLARIILFNISQVELKLLDLASDRAL